ncbi:MAG: hypothetical protein OZ928_21635 [Polyangiaceae bacterium]|nr:hypothetical protein [Polyangiaceae bacterium]
MVGPDRAGASGATADVALEDEEPALAALAAASAPGTVPAGPAPRRQEPIKLRNAAALAQTKGSCAAEHRFSLHAAPIAAADDRAGREALCKYIRRPLQARA